MLLLGGQNSIQRVLIAVPNSLLFNFADKYKVAQNAVSTFQGLLSTVPGPLLNLGIRSAESAGTRHAGLLLEKSVVARLD